MLSTVAPVTQPVPAPPPGVAPIERVRVAYLRRHETDYVFSFWTALGWTLLTCGIYALYVIYQLLRRDREHNRRRLELLEATNELAWRRALEAGLAEELRPNFERVGEHLRVLRQMTTDFREPWVWVVLAVVGGGIVNLVAYVLLDQDLVRHDYHEGGAEHELAHILGRLGTPVPAPDPARLKRPHAYVARVVVTVLTLGLYGLWWTYNVMVEGNRHFAANWAWEDGLAAALAPGATGAPPDGPPATPGTATPPAPPVGGPPTGP